MEWTQKNLTNTLRLSVLGNTSSGVMTTHTRGPNMTTPLISGRLLEAGHDWFRELRLRALALLSDRFDARRRWGRSASCRSNQTDTASECRRPS
jgi:hypothetical protein